MVPGQAMRRGGPGGNDARINPVAPASRQNQQEQQNVDNAGN